MADTPCSISCIHLIIHVFMISLTLRVWEVAITEKTRKILPTDCNLGQLKRIVNCIEVNILYVLFTCK